MCHAGAVWSAERRQLWREPVPQAYLHLGGGPRQPLASLAQAPACLQILPAHHQPAGQCSGLPLLLLTTAQALCFSDPCPFSLTISLPGNAQSWIAGNDT